MINWPDIKFPPVNLHSAPVWPPQYLTMEANFVHNLVQQYFNENNSAKKLILLSKIQEKREEFNRLWNARSRG